ncbi:reverse transcriptase domain-containing protein [Tanacetum coccineum]
MAQENRKSFGRCTSHHHKEDPKIALEDSWNDSSEDDHEESYPMATGSPKVHLNLSHSDKALSKENLENENCELIKLNEDFTKKIKALLREKQILKEETNKLTNKANELESKIEKDIKVKEVIEPYLNYEKLTHMVDSLKNDMSKLQNRTPNFSKFKKNKNALDDMASLITSLNKSNIIKIFYHGLSEITQEVLNAAAGCIFLYKTPNQAYQLLEDKVLLKLDWAKNQKTKSSLKKTVAFADEGSSNSDIDKIMARMDAMTLKMDQYKELQSSAKKTKHDLNEDDIPMSCEEEAKFMQTSIQNLETKFDRLADKQSGRPSRSLPSNTQPNPKGHNSKAYQPPQSRCIHKKCDDEDEPTPQPKIETQKLIKETSLLKPYKPKILYPQCLRKEKMEAQYGKFLDMIRAVRINVPLVDVLAGMPNYGKFLKELLSNKHKIEQIFAAFLSDESSAIIQNKVPPKLGDPESFFIPCNFNKTFSCNALADLGASINHMPYSLYAKLSLETLKPTKMSVRLADRPFQYPVGIAENMLVEVGKFTFLADFVILEMEEDSKVPLILGRPFLHTADAVIRVKQKQLNLGVRTE